VEKPEWNDYVSSQYGAKPLAAVDFDKTGAEWKALFRRLAIRGNNVGRKASMVAKKKTPTNIQTVAI